MAAHAWKGRPSISFIKTYIEQQTIQRRNFLLASAAGMGRLTRPAAFTRAALADPVIAWSYRDRANPYWFSIGGGEAFVESIGRPKSDLVNLINQGASGKSLADIKARLAI